MLIKKQIIVTASLVVVALVSIATIDSTQQPTTYTNLQVLPKDISSKALQEIMVDEFQDGLGVGCNYCHAREKGSLRLNYASDEKPEKEIARTMMRMTMEINKKYFGVENPLIGDNLMTVSCSNCHRGTAHPEK
jgi:major membrane immunogen (membrane-anchored lipoprotein)